MKKKVDIHHYEDIINMPRHVSKVHPPMPKEDRAAQFAPFAALTGHKEAVSETERLTENKRILDENQKEIIDRKLQYIQENIKKQPLVKVIYFVKDKTKGGGAYVEMKARVKKINDVEKTITFCEGKKINICDLYDIDVSM